MERLIRQREAEATAQGITWSDLAAEVDPDYEDPQGLLGTPNACHVALINYMGPTQLFEMLCQVCCPASLSCQNSALARRVSKPCVEQRLEVR